MSEIILPSSEEQEEGEELVVNYNATKEDEECFLLMYFMKCPPSEAYEMDAERRRWLIARFMMQKNMEQEAMMQQRMMAQIGGNIKL